ncbi:MAG TPA: hypothetical protein PLA27_03750 [Anaerolineales bacterium]|jgi:hypothetical protein|nr:hypothetical protein [Anaerolineales bacterium]HQX15511.1 hypothetical protein [Anaerolineales bacterium]
MVLTSRTQNLLTDLQKIMALNEDEIVQRGIAQATTDRIVELRQRMSQLTEQYGGIEKLEAQSKSAPADDHTLYTDLLEWRAVRHELERLANFLENV